MGRPPPIMAFIIVGLVLTVAVVLALLVAIVWLLVKLIGCIIAFLGSAFAGSLVAILLLALILAALALLVWFIFFVHRLPLSLIGFGNLANLPAVPFRVSELPGTALMLATRRRQIEQAMNGLSVRFTIAGRSAEAYVFMFGTPSDPSLTTLSLDEAEQFAMAWTTFDDVERDARPLLSGLADTLRKPEYATQQFWPTIANHGLSFNLIVLAHVTGPRADKLRADLGAAWTDEMQALQAAGNLYAIDMRLFTAAPVVTVDGFSRFTPATLTLLRRENDANNASNAILPFWIRVAGQDGADQQDYVPSDAAWLYALQAAKTSITVWGIWNG